MDIVIVLDGSNSIYPWDGMNAFLENLIPSLDIGPQSTQVTAARGPDVRGRTRRLFILPSSSRQVSIIQYSVQPKFEFRLKEYTNKEDLLRAASRVTQMSGESTNTFTAIQYARLVCCVTPSVLLWSVLLFTARR